MIDITKEIYENNGIEVIVDKNGMKSMKSMKSVCKKNYPIKT